MKSKKASLLLFLGLALALCLPMAANAALTDNGDGTITDGNGIMWLQSPAETAMTWDEAVAWADALVFAGYDDWRLPSAVNPMTGLPVTDQSYYGSVPSGQEVEFPYLYMNEWGNPWGRAGGYSLPPKMELMPDYWDNSPLNWWCAEEYADTDACAFMATWDAVGWQHTVPKSSYCSVTAVRDDTGEPPELEAPVASFTASPSTAPVDDPIAFDASSSFDPDGTIVSYEWDFGDGDTATGVTTSHAYSADGMYTVTLTVTDNDGLTATAADTVTAYLETPNSIPEVPFGTIAISASLIIALGVYFAMPRFRGKSGHIKP